MYRRSFLIRGGKLLGLFLASAYGPTGAAPPPRQSSRLTLFLGGDVMTGRGVDQILAHPGDPELHETYVRHAGRYVELAEAVHGEIRRPVEASYIWGDALVELRAAAPDVRIVNLETAVTTSDDWWRGKGIHYRMHPRNVDCLGAASLDCCALANNHVLDWGEAGLVETLETLLNARIATAGAGRDRRAAEAPAVLDVPRKGRVIVVALGTADSGIPTDWAAGEERPGVNLLPSLSAAGVDRVAAAVAEVRRPRDIVVASIHWGSNWGYRIPERQRWFAQRLIDRAGVDVVHGHSSHHPRGIEVYRERPILHGCGDLLNDYEGIGGYEKYRSDLVLGYLVSLDAATGRLAQLTMMPFQIRRLRLHRAAREDTHWLRDRLDRICRPLGTRVEIDGEGRLQLRWLPGDAEPLTPTESPV